MVLDYEFGDLCSSPLFLYREKWKRRRGNLGLLTVSQPMDGMGWVKSCTEREDILEDKAAHHLKWMDVQKDLERSTGEFWTAEKEWGQERKDLGFVGKDQLKPESTGEKMWFGEIRVFLPLTLVKTSVVSYMLKFSHLFLPKETRDWKRTIPRSPRPLCKLAGNHFPCNTPGWGAHPERVMETNEEPCATWVRRTLERWVELSNTGGSDFNSFWYAHTRKAGLEPPCGNLCWWINCSQGPKTLILTLRFEKLIAEF